MAERPVLGRPTTTAGRNGPFVGDDGITAAVDTTTYPLTLTAAFIDEIPAAYRDIDVVMADAADLVTVKHTLHQLVNLKGD